jgi:hypothetical protein
MKKLLFALAVVILIAPMSRPALGQDGGFGGGDSIDVTGIFTGDRGGRGGFGRGGPQIPDARLMVSDLKSTLKKGKTPLDKDQEKPIENLLSADIVTLSDQIQLLRSGNGQNGQNFPGGRNGGGVPAGGNPAGAQANPQENVQAIQVDTIASLKNDDFLDNKISSFLSPEQVALVQKARDDDKNNSTCLDGLFDRAISQPLNAGRGNNNRGNFNNSSSATKPNGQPYCMSATATPSDRLDPIRKVLEKGNLPLAADKEPIAEVFVVAQIKSLEDSLRASLTSGNGGGYRGGFNNGRKNNPQLVIQDATDTMYKKVEALLRPDQAETLKKWHLGQILDRGGIESLLAVESVQGTPLSDPQAASVNVAWPEIRNQLQESAKSDHKKMSDKELDRATTDKILEMLDPPQMASYQAALKYDPDSTGDKDDKKEDKK